MTPTDRIIQKIMCLMQWDTEQAGRWLETPNPHFGNMMPVEMYLSGREAKVEAFVDAKLMDELEGLRVRLKILEEALEWYANWDWSDKYVQAVPLRARKALGWGKG